MCRLKWPSLKAAHETWKRSVHGVWILICFYLLLFVAASFSVHLVWFTSPTKRTRGEVAASILPVRRNVGHAKIRHLPGAESFESLCPLIGVDRHIWAQITIFLLVYPPRKQLFLFFLCYFLLVNSVFMLCHLVSSLCCRVK